MDFVRSSFRRTRAEQVVTRDSSNNYEADRQEGAHKTHALSEQQQQQRAAEKEKENQRRETKGTTTSRHHLHRGSQVR